MATIRETILGVRPGLPKAIPLSEVSDVAAYRTEAGRINNDLRAKGVKTKDNRPPYTISKNAKIGYMYILNNME